MMFFVRMIRLVPLVAIILVVGLIIYLVAQAKYSPNKAKSIIIKVFIGIFSVLAIFFVLCCLYSVLDRNIPALELFLSFATVPIVGLLITLVCRFIFYKHHPKYKLEAKKTSQNESFVEFWKRRIKKFLVEFLNKNMRR